MRTFSRTSFGLMFCVHFMFTSSLQINRRWASFDRAKHCFDNHARRIVISSYSRLGHARLERQDLKSREEKMSLFSLAKVYYYSYYVLAKILIRRFAEYISKLSYSSIGVSFGSSENCAQHGKATQSFGFGIRSQNSSRGACE